MKKQRERGQKVDRDDGDEKKVNLHSHSMSSKGVEYVSGSSEV